jgi:glycosyltransferase 2 family protein
MRFNWKTVVGTVLSVGLLGAMFLLVDFQEVVEQLRQADPFWFTLAVIVATLSIPVRALRWKVMLHPVAPGMPFHPRNAATAIGFAANNVLPARAGEFARAFVLGRLTGIPVTAALGTLVVERIFDGLVIVALLFVAMAMPQFPAGMIAGVDPRNAAALVALAMATVGVVLFALVYAPKRTVRIIESLVHRLLPVRFQRFVLEVLHSFLRGVAVLRSPRLFVLSLLWALGQWVFLALSYYFALLAFGITAPGFAGAVFLQSLVSLAVAAPSAPGYVGTFHAGAVLGLSLWGVGAEKAVSFAIAFHIGGFIPVTLLGAYYVWRLNLSWNQIEASQDEVEHEIEHEMEQEAERGTSQRGG